MHKTPKTALAGLSTAILYKDPYQTVRHIEAQADSQVTLDATDGVEILVLHGTLNQVSQDSHILRQGSWMGCPCSDSINLEAVSKGTKVWAFAFCQSTLNLTP